MDSSRPDRLSARPTAVLPAVTAEPAPERPSAESGIRISVETLVDVPAGSLAGREQARLGARVEARTPKREHRSVRPARPALADADPLIGQIVAGRYKILSLLGRGGMGVVYKVEHLHIGKLMAMKLLSGEFASDATTVRRFRREAKAISKLAHPNTVQIFDFGESARLVYLVMEYLPGRDFGALIQEAGSLPFARVAAICEQVADSVSEAHDRGVIHRDIKPENVMVIDNVVQRDFVKVLDFGIAQLREGEELCGETQSGTVVGTPYYMAPEQIRGESIDGRVDVYALGAMMYKALTGFPPFVGSSPMAVFSMHLADPLVPLNERLPGARIPEQAQAIVAKALEKDRSKRYAHVRDLRDDLRRYLAQTTAPDYLPDVVEPARRPGHDSLAPTGLVARRDDVDRYEKRLRRTNLLAQVLGVLLILSVVHAVYFLLEEGLMVPSEEVEPNDLPYQATLLPERLSLKGQLGKRLSRVRGDEDIYRIEAPHGGTHALEAQVTPLPNMDIVLELEARGQRQPLLLVNGGGLGEGERIPNFALRGGSYYLRVRENQLPSRMPTENVSDWYSISFRFIERKPADESEANDTLEGADTLEPGVARSGYLGWEGDRDVYCFAPPERPLVIELSGAASADLALRLLDRGSPMSVDVNAAGRGAGERLEVAPGSLGAPCVEVSASQAPEGARMDAEHPYILLMQTSDAPAPVGQQLAEPARR